jgi:hypothetical protein
MNVRKSPANHWYGSHILVIAALTLTSACNNISVPATTPTSGMSNTVVAPLTIDTLRNAEYRGIHKDQVVKLTDGIYEGKPFVEGGASRPTVTITDTFATGDLNNDRMDDAVVVLVENSGGSGYFYYLAAVVNRNGATNNVDTELLGDRIKVKAISIDAGKIVVDMIDHGPRDLLCCPTEEVTRTFRLEKNTLIGG